MDYRAFVARAPVSRQKVVRIIQSISETVLGGDVRPDKKAFF